MNENPTLKLKDNNDLVLHKISDLLTRTVDYIIVKSDDKSVASQIESNDESKSVSEAILFNNDVVSAILSKQLRSKFNL